MGLLITLIASLLALFCLLVLYLYYKNAKTRKYFESNGIPYLEMRLVMGFLFGNSSIIKSEEGIYKAAIAKSNKSPIVAFLDFAANPNLYVTDLDLVKSICVKDFDHFVDRRGVKTKESNHYLQKMVVFTESEKWKGIRAKLSPLFTTGKIKRMFQIFQKSSENLSNYMKEQMTHPSKKSIDIDFMQIISKYTMDAIASCAFGIESKSFDVKLGQRSTFEEMGSKYGFKFTPKFLFRFIVMTVVPKIADIIGMNLFDQEAETYFVTVIKDVMKRRRQTGEKRDDFLQLMMEVQEGIVKADEESNAIMNGDVEGDEDGKRSSGISKEMQGNKLVFDDDHIIANGLLFLLAGFDPTQSVLLFTLYALAVEEEVQKKLYKEVKMIMDKSGGQLTYDGMNEMKYLDLVVNESTRRYTPSSRTERQCTKNYKVPGTDFVIKKGSIMVIPIHGFHQDERYFPDPQAFIPERFTPENKASRHAYAWLPFGHGSRNCIGNRFALVKVKAALAQLVYTFHFAPCSKTKIPLEFDRNANVKPKDDLWLNVTLRE